MTGAVRPSRRGDDPAAASQARVMGCLLEAALGFPRLAGQPAHDGEVDGDLTHGVSPRLTVALRIPEIPVAKGQPRMTSRGGWNHVYTDARTMSAERRISSHAQQQLGPAWVPLAGPIRVGVTVYRAVPTNLPKRLWLTALPTQREDLDNHLRLLFDALTPHRPGDWGVWCDDAQIVEIHAAKRYAVGCEPCWHVVVESLSGVGNWQRSSRADSGAVGAQGQLSLPRSRRELPHDDRRSVEVEDSGARHGCRS